MKDNGIWLLSCMALFFLGCGDLSNSVFQDGTGTIRGQLLWQQQASQGVSIYAMFSDRSPIESGADGSFELQVDSGTQRVLAIDENLSHGILVDVLVIRDHDMDIGKLSLQNTAVINGSVQLDSGDAAKDAKVGIPGGLWAPSVNPDGSFQIKPVPPGCYPVRATLKDYRPMEIEVCPQEGQTLNLAPMKFSKSCQAMTEVCDGQDNDCDGETDNDCVKLTSCDPSSGNGCAENSLCADIPGDSCDLSTGGENCPGVCVKDADYFCHAQSECPDGFSCQDVPNDACIPPGDPNCLGVCASSAPQSCGQQWGFNCPRGEFCGDIPDDGCEYPSIFDCLGVCLRPWLLACKSGPEEACLPPKTCVDLTDGCDPANGNKSCPGYCLNLK